jgi:hypothetical protein
MRHHHLRAALLLRLKWGRPWSVNIAETTGDTWIVLSNVSLRRQ